MKQQSLTSFEKFGKTTWRAQFLLDMDQIFPWPELAAAAQTVYPKISENGGRPPIPVERMLRIYFLQLWFNLSDPAVEEALYDSVAMRGFAGIDLGVESVPDETTVCKFRHLLERHKLGKTLLTAVTSLVPAARRILDWRPLVQAYLHPDVVTTATAAHEGVDRRKRQVLADELCPAHEIHRRFPATFGAACVHPVAGGHVAKGLAGQRVHWMSLTPHPGGCGGGAWSPGAGASTIPLPIFLAAGVPLA